MRLHIVSVGRWKGASLQDAFDDYAHRLRGLLILHEVDARRKASGAELQRLEAEALIAAVPPHGAQVALDPTGRALSSEALADRLTAWADQGRADVAFLIGGADGLHPSVLDRSELVLSFGPMTWPHLLVRVMLAEQLYRASMINAGHPYHRG